MRAYLNVVLILAIGVSSSAQLPPCGQRYSRDEQTLERFTKQIHERLFSGIALSRTQDSVAHRVIHESLLKRESLDPTSTAFLERARAIIDERNSALVALLRTPADRSVFERNSRVPIFMADCVMRQLPRS